MKEISLIFSTLTLFLFVTTAQAEHKLLVTDVLEAGEHEVGASLGYAYHHINYRRNDLNATASSTLNLLDSNYSFGAGVGHDLEMSIAMPFALKDNVKYEYNTTPPSSRNADRDGWGDLSIQLKYRALGDARKSFALVTALNVKPKTGDKNQYGTGTTDISPYVAISTVIDKDLRPYALYQATFRNHGAENHHIVQAGLEYELNKSFTVRPSMSAKFRTSSETMTPYNSYSGKLDCYIQTFRNLYLIPTVHAGVSTAASTKSGVTDYDRFSNYGGGVGLYYFFD